MARTLIQTGGTYGSIKVLSVAQVKPKLYNCQCIKCGSCFVDRGQRILMYATIGCKACRKKVKDSQRVIEAQQYIGLKSGELTVDEILGLRDYNKKRLIFVRCRCSCGSYPEVPLDKIKSMQVLTCGHNRQKQLDTGREAIKSVRISGTLIPAINGQRKVNKNSNTGYTGVSYMPQHQKYRAYINFRRQQYYLGLYDHQDDAIKARKAAEKQIYGPFLEWYAAEYPEQWERIQQKQT